MKHLQKILVSLKLHLDKAKAVCNNHQWLTFSCYIFIDYSEFYIAFMKCLCGYAKSPRNINIRPIRFGSNNLRTCTGVLMAVEYRNASTVSL